MLKTSLTNRAEKEGAEECSYEMKIAESGGDGKKIPYTG